MADVKLLESAADVSVRPVVDQLGAAARTSPRRAYAIYCVALVLVPFACFAGSLLIARSSWFLQHERNSYLTISDYAFTLKNADCGVVIYGDSSALTGVAPQVIERNTGLRTCNIAQPNTTLAIASTFALDEYLRHNAPPKFLIFQFTAPDFAPIPPGGRLYEEGTLQLVRHKLDAATAGLFARHPLETLAFSEFILRSALLERDRSGNTYASTWEGFRASGGLFTAPVAPLEKCVSSLEVREPDLAYISALRAKYSARGTRVLVFAAPYPDCDKAYDYYSEKLRTVADAPLQRFDVHLFNEKNHFTREGAERNAARIAVLIQRLMQARDGVLSSQN